MADYVVRVPKGFDQAQPTGSLVAHAAAWMYRMYRTLPTFVLVALAAVRAFAGPAEEQYSVAARHYEQRRWSAASDEFSAFLRKYPEHHGVGNALFFHAESLAQQRRYDEARSQFDDFLRRFPEHRFVPQALFRSGEGVFLAGRNDEARKLLEQFRTKFPDHELNAYVLPYLGELELGRNDLKQADAHYRDALKRFPQGALSSECRFGLARVLELQGDAEQSLRFYQYVAQNDRSHLHDDAQLQIGLLHHQQQRPDEADEALKAFENRLASSTLRTQARYWRGVIRMSQKNWAAASEILAQAVADDPQSPFAPAIAFSAAEALRYQGQTDAAAKQYEQIVNQWPASQWADDSLQIRIELAVDAQDHARVMRLVKQFEEHYADSNLRLTVHRLFGRSLLKQQRYDDAAALFEALLMSTAPADDASEPNPNAAAHASVRFHLALCHLGRKRYEDALAALEPVNLDEANEDLAAMIHAARGAALIGLERFADALEPLNAYVAAKPQGGEAAKCRAQAIVALVRLDRIEEADESYRAYRKAHAKDAGFAATTLLVAEAAYARGRYVWAAELFALLTADSLPAEFIERGFSGLAWCQLRNGQTAQAETTFAKLAEQFPRSDRSAEALFARATLLEERQQFTAALQGYVAITEQKPVPREAAEALYRAALLHLRLDQREPAADKFERLARDFPQFAQLDAVLYQAAWLAHDLGQAEKADALFARLTADFRDSRYWADATYRLAERAARGTDAQRADKLIDELLASSAGNEVKAHALYLRGQLAAAARRWDDVGTAMQRIVNDFPQSVLKLPAEFWFAESLYRQKKYDAAGPLFDELATKLEGRTDDWAPTVPLRQAQLLAHAQRWAEANELALTIGERFPNFRQQYEVDYLLGRCLASRAQFADARAAYERVVRSSTGGRTETAAMAQWMIGETYFLQKQYDEAIRAYHRVESLFDYPRWQAAALLQAGKCHEAQGAWQKAIELYAQLLQQFPDTKHADEAAQRLRAVRARPDTASVRR